MSRILLCIAFVGLASCDAVVDVASEAVSAVDPAPVQAPVKSIVNQAVSQYFPGGQATAVTDCVIENASAEELLAISVAAIDGLNSSSTSLDIDIASRPGTVSCVLDRGAG